MDSLTLLNDLYFINKEYKKKNKNKSLYFNVIPADYLEKEKNFRFRKSFLIINTDNSDSPGQHWVSMTVYPSHSTGKTVCEFFDSYGLKPSINHFKKFIKKHCDKLFYNKKKIQGPFSFNCGLYSICNLYYSSKNKKMSAFTDLFKDGDYNTNDKKIETMYSRIFGRLHKKHKKRKNQYGGINRIICNQTCKSLAECKKHCESK